MAKFSFGNAADYSTLFGNIYNGNVAKQKAQTVADQNAMDADTYSQWQSGMISDTDWLNYIAQRVKDTADQQDVKGNEHWVQMQREYTASIADNQALATYQAGGSINDYIAYLQNRVAGLNVGSTEYKNLANQLMSMQDTRSQNDISTGAQAILDQINAGTKSYKDLLSFYQAQVGNIRSGNSTLAKDLASKIQETKNQIRSDTISSAFGKLQYQWDAGQLTGSEVAAQIRSLANTYYKNDPTKYYSALDQAIKMDKAGGSTIAGSRGARRRSGGGSAYPRYTKAQKSAIDLGKAQIGFYTEIAKQIKQGQPYITLPDGTTYQNTPSLRAQVFNGYYKAANALAGQYLGAKRSYEAQKVATDKAYFITTYVQPSNDLNVQAHVTQMMASLGTAVQAASANVDPTAVLQVVQDFAGQFEKYGQSLSVDQVAAHAAAKPSRNLDLSPAEMVRTVPLAAQDRPTPAVQDEVASLAAYLKALSNPYLTPQQRAEYLTSISQTGDSLGMTQHDAVGKLVPSDALRAITDIVAGPDSQPTTGEIKGAAPQVAAILGPNPTGVMVATPEGVKVVAMKSGLGNTDPTTGVTPVVGKPDFSSVLGKGQQMAWVLMDVNGTPTPVRAVMNRFTNDSFKAWQNAGPDIKLPDGTKILKGGWVPSTALGDATVQAAIQAGAVVKAPVTLGLGQVVIPAYSDHGQSYAAQQFVYDPQTRTFYDHLPLSYVNTTGPDGTVVIDNQGNVQKDYKSFATAAGMPLAYSGSHNYQAQVNYNNGVYSGLDGMQPPLARGPGGAVDPTQPGDYSSAYYAFKSAKADGGADGLLPDNWALNNDPSAKIADAKSAWASQVLDYSQNEGKRGPTGYDMVGQLAAGAGLRLGPAFDGPTAARGRPVFDGPSAARGRPAQNPLLDNLNPNFNTPAQRTVTSLPTVQLPNPVPPTFTPPPSLSLPNIAAAQSNVPNFSAPNSAPAAPKPAKSTAPRLTLGPSSEPTSAPSSPDRPTAL